MDGWTDGETAVFAFFLFRLCVCQMPPTLNMAASLTNYECFHRDQAHNYTAQMAWQTLFHYHQIFLSFLFFLCACLFLFFSTRERFFSAVDSMWGALGGALRWNTCPPPPHPPRQYRSPLLITLPRPRAILGSLRLRSDSSVTGASPCPSSNLEQAGEQDARQRRINR